MVGFLQGVVLLLLHVTEIHKCNSLVLDINGYKAHNSIQNLIYRDVIPRTKFAPHYFFQKVID